MSKMIELHVSKRDKDRGAIQRWIPAHRVVERLQALRDPRSWISNTNQDGGHTATPPLAIMQIDAIIEMLT